MGVSLTELAKMSADEERLWIEKKAGEKIIFNKKKRHGIIGRGNPLLSRRKIRTIEDLEKKSHDIFDI